MKRRDYIKSILWASGAMYVSPQLLLSCNDESAQNFPFAGDISQQPMATFEEIRNASRLSKGHLQYEMQRVVNTKDAKAIYNFVNQNIKLIPCSDNSSYYDYETIRWGQQGTLRYGKGTLREKTNLLFSMLKEAGFNPSLHYNSLKLSPELINTAFLSPKETHQVIEAPNSFIKKWNKTFEKEDIVAAIDEHQINPQQAKELAAQIAKQLPEDALDLIKMHDLFRSSSIYVPVIQFSENGTLRHINVFENLPFEQNCKAPSGTLAENKIGYRIGKVKATITAKYSGNRKEQIPLVTGSWDYKDLVGKQIAIQFTSVLPTLQLLSSRIEEVNQFIAFLTLVDPNLSVEERRKHSFQGIGFDTFGNTFQKNADGSVSVNDLKINTESLTKTSDVASIKALLIDDYYPSISIRIAPLDANGKPVFGLPNSAFTITDQGKAMQAVVSQNSLVKNVLVLIDSSGSMPYHYQSARLPDAIRTKIENAFTKEFEQVSLHYKTFNVQTDFLEVLTKESANSYDAIICFGDGGEVETLTAEALKVGAKEASVSYHYLKTNFGAESHQKVQQCFEGAGLFFGFMDNFSEDITTITQSIKTKIHYPYVVTYQSPTSEELNHNVTLQLNGNNKVPQQNLNYTVNDKKNYLQPSVPIGLQLQLEWKQGYKTKKVARDLVGYNENKLLEENQIKNYAKAVRDYVLGSHYISFESDKPTLPALVDQLYSQVLTQAQLIDDNSTFKEQISALENEQFIPMQAITTYTGVSDDIGENRLTFQDGFQAILFSEYYDFEKQEEIQNIDMLPTSNLVTIAKTKAEVLTKTLENSAYLALSETQQFSISTYSQLKGKALKLYNRSDKHPFSDRIVYAKNYDYHLLYDASLSNKSYWQIKKTTGELLGILPNGSGGGLSSKQQRIEMAMQIWDAYTKTLVKVTRGGLAMGIVALYGMFLVEMYALVALVVNDMGAYTDWEKDMHKIMKKYAKKGYKRVKGSLKK